MSDRTKIYPLTSGRFIAAFLIVLAHSAGPAPFGYQFSLITQFILGSAGVSFFFVLSGFILTYTYGQLENAGAVRNFWAARFSRIWPTHALTFVLCIALLPAGEWAFGGNAILPALANITLTHAGIPVPRYYFSFNSPSWSISTELYFYLLYPLASMALVRKPWLPVVAGALAVVAMIAITVGFDFAQFSPAVLAEPTSHGMMSVHPLTRFFEFACGMYAAQLWMSGRGRIELTRTAATALELAALALVVGSVIGFQHLAAALEAQHYPDAVTQWIHFGSSAIPFALLIFVLALERGYLARLLSLPFLVILGEISFAMYILHQVVLRVLGAHKIAAPAGYGWPMFALFCVFIVGLSYAVWVGLERPARRGLNRLLSRKPAGAP